MKRVNKSKEPTTDQMLRMAQNLQSLPKITYASVDFEATAYMTGNTTVVFIISLQPGHDDTTCSVDKFQNWVACQDFYFQLMKGE